GLLWSESSEEKARASLRQTLHGLRAALGKVAFAGLGVGREEVRLQKSDISVDAAEVADLASRGQAHKLLLERARLPETLLAGFDDLDPSFRVWLLVQRQALHQQLERHLEQALADARSGAARPLASALVNLDPTHEEASRRLMLEQAELGDTAGALKIYKR